MQKVIITFRFLHYAITIAETTPEQKILQQAHQLRRHGTPLSEIIKQLNLPWHKTTLIRKLAAWEAQHTPANPG